MRVLVTGAGGFVGRHLVRHLAAAGHEVVPLRRGASGAKDVGGSFEGPADLAEIEDFPFWPAGIEAIAHVAALNPQRGDAGAQDLVALRHANVAGTAALARRARREAVSRIVLVSSASVHAGGVAPIREGDPLRPATPYALSKAEAEETFWQALGPGGPTTGCVLRPPPVFGPGGRNAVAALARLARLPMPLPLGGLGQPRSLVSVESLAEAITLCLTQDAAGGETFLAANDGPLTPAEIVAALRKGLRLRRAILPAPVKLGTLAARLTGKETAWEKLRQGLVLDTGHIRRQLGWQPGSASVALSVMAAKGLL